MVSKELVRARLKEAAAQRRYDFAVLVTTTVMTIIGVTIPASAVVLLYADSQIDKARSAFDTFANMQVVRADDFRRECLTSADKEAEEYYCSRVDAQEKYAAEVVMQGWQKRMTFWPTVLAWLFVLGCVAIAAGAGALASLWQRGRALAEAQERRIQLEANEDTRPPLALAGRRRRRPRAGVRAGP
ncbi:MULTISPECIES: hypothetical protein [unclassified Kribbella]|uniref:hypothetical protein n=1 Tax=unclassified Kribbella TaxID=2644121 RepID=UPI00301B3664